MHYLALLCQGVLKSFLKLSSTARLGSLPALWPGNGVHYRPAEYPLSTPIMNFSELVSKMDNLAVHPGSFVLITDAFQRGNGGYYIP